MLVPLAICFAIAATQPEPDPSPAAAPPSWLVQIESKSAPDAPPTFAPGFISTSGSVITTLDSLASTTEAAILTPDGQRHPTRGIVAHRASANLAALVVDWSGPAPDRAPLAASSPKPGASLTAWLLPYPPEKPVQSGSIAGSRLSGPCFQLDIPRSLALCRSGAIAVDDQGRVIGLGASAQLITPPDDATRLSLARPELLAALKPGDLVKWSDWPATRERYKRAEELSTEALANAQRNQLKLASRQVSQALVFDPVCAAGLRAKGDILKVRLHRRQWLSGEDMKTIYTVLEVLEHRRATVQLPLPPS